MLAGTHTEIRLTANRVDFSALSWGDDSAPLALLLHGYPDSAWTWRHLGPLLAERGWRAVAPFTRGYAPTGLAPDDRYRPADLVKDALALHRELGGDRRAVLVGHDWGAVATWGVTEVAPDRFSRHVAMSVPPMSAIFGAFTTPRRVPIGLRQLRMSWYMAYNQLPGISERALDELIPRLWRDWSPGYDGAEDAARALAALDTPERRRAALRYYRETFQAGLLSTIRARAGAPALYLHGAEDGCMQAALTEQHPGSLPPGSRFEVIPGTGHFLHLEDPERVNGLILEWLGAPPS